MLGLRRLRHGFGRELQPVRAAVTKNDESDSLTRSGRLIFEPNDAIVKRRVSKVEHVARGDAGARCRSLGVNDGDLEAFRVNQAIAKRCLRREELDRRGDVQRECNRSGKHRSVALPPMQMAASLG